MRRWALATALVAVAVFAAGCTDDPSAQYFATRPPSSPQAQQVNTNIAANVDAGLLATRLLHGGVSRPNPKLTPGVIAVKDLTTVCRGPKRIRGLFTPSDPLISLSTQRAVFAEYQITAANQKHYGLDFLVPLQLGGANTVANIWPASTSHGVGFHEKQVLNIRIHELVCERAMTLDEAQKSIATDWVKLWLNFG
jgi:hypothetical protein